MTIKFYVCIISKPSVYSHWCSSLETLSSGQNWRFFVPCVLKIWWMTLKNIRTPLLCCLTRCASFQIHECIQTGVTVRKRPTWVKIIAFLAINGWPSKTRGHLFEASSSFVHHFIAIFAETAKWGYDLCDLDLWPLTLTFCIDITFVIGNNSWTFHDDTVMGT